MKLLWKWLVCSWLQISTDKVTLYLLCSIGMFVSVIQKDAQTAAKSSQLMTKTLAVKPLIVVVPPPNTNTYSLSLGWNPVTTADSYTLYVGLNPSSLTKVTNVAASAATVSIPATNAYPWLGVTASNPSGESLMSQLLTRTNYFQGWVEHGAINGPWQQMPETMFQLEATGPLDFFRMHGNLHDNFRP